MGLREKQDGRTVFIEYGAPSRFLEWRAEDFALRYRLI
jgi:hypothetical protein